MSRRGSNRKPPRPAPVPVRSGVLDAAGIARFQANHRWAFWLGAGCFGVGLIGVYICKLLGWRPSDLPLWATPWVLLFRLCAPGVWIMSIFSWRKSVPAKAYLLATIVGLALWVAAALAISW